MWFVKKKKKSARRQRRRALPHHKHYADHKELARSIIHERLAYWNVHYNFAYKRVAVRNQKRRWGSCSEHGNLNFNYKIIFLPEALMDYVIVHELCHLAELNHSQMFWDHVALTVPEYKKMRAYLRRMTHVPHKGFPSSRFVSTVKSVS